MSRQQPVEVCGQRPKRFVALMVALARRRYSALLRMTLLVTLLALSGQGVVQHWHTPVHLAEQMQSLSAADQTPDLHDLNDCQSCSLLKLSQVGALPFALLPGVGSVTPRTTLRLLEAVGQRLIPPSARGPPALSATFN